MWGIERFDPSPAIAKKIRPPSVEVPRQPSDSKMLAIKPDRVVVPLLRMDASTIELAPVNPPVCRRFANVTRSAQVADINAARLLDRSSAVSAPPPRRLVIAPLPKLIGFFHNVFLSKSALHVTLNARENRDREQNDGLADL